MFGEVATLQIPAVTTASADTLEETQSFSYAASTDIPCRFYELSAREIARQDGQAIQVEAEAQFRADVTVQPETLTDAATGERRQVRIKAAPGASWVLWEVIACRTLGNVGARKALALRRWKR